MVCVWPADISLHTVAADAEKSLIRSIICNGLSENIGHQVSDLIKPPDIMTVIKVIGLTDQNCCSACTDVMRVYEPHAPIARDREDPLCPDGTIEERGKEILHKICSDIDVSKGQSALL